MTLKSSLEKLAQAIVNRASAADTSFENSVEALKALTALYATFLKDKGKSDDDAGGFTMADAQSMIEDEHGSETAVRGRRGRSGPGAGN